MKRSVVLAMGMSLGSLAMAGPALAAGAMGNDNGTNYSMSESGSMSGGGMSAHGGMRAQGNQGEGAYTTHSGVPLHGPQSWYIAPLAKYTAEDNERSSGWGAGGSLRLGKILSEHMNVELALSGSHFYENTSEWDTFTGGLHGLFYFFRGRAIHPNLHFSPFVDVGASFVRSRTRDTDISDHYTYSNDPAFNADLGTTVRLNNYGLKLRLEGGYQWTLYSGGGNGREVFAEPVGLVGLQIPLSSQEPPPPPQPKVRDHDHDGVMDPQDQCPNTSRGIQVNAQGCALDSDHDNVPDSQDQCPNTQQGTPVNSNGCPTQKKTKDQDSDGVPDAKDQCPNTPKNQEVTRNGCAVKATRTLRGVTFALNRADLTGESEDALSDEADRLKKVFNQHSNARANVNGYTDSSGPSDYNRKLSQKRADAVRTYLIGQGISPSRLNAQGMGESNPVATNDTRTGRLQNRRVEIKVLKK